MSINFEKLPDSPILILTFVKPVKPEEDIKEFNATCAEMLEEIDTPLWAIADLRDTKITFAMLVAGLGAATKNVPGSARDPRIHPIVVGHGKLIEMISSSMEQLQYGGLKVPIFSSVEDAVAYAQEKAAG